MPPSLRAFVPHSIDDRAYWDQRRTHPATAEMAAQIIAHAEAAPAQPPVPLASDFLAARRFNDRQRLDRYWRVHRGTLSSLCGRRALLGMDPNDPDDRLLDWLWSALTQPTWVVSAHLPGQDLPGGGTAQMDLAATEMAATMAETREILLPWIQAQSSTLADTIIYEIDRRVLQPFLDGVASGWWANRGKYAHRNNWSGVCAGSILAAAISLEHQGHPRPEAKALAIEVLNRFLDEGLTPSGECDEGVMYWGYGVGFACVGLQRLTPEELSSNVDVARLKEVASYPGRAHLFNDAFYARNDSGLKSPAHAYFVPWLALATGDAFLRRWMAVAPMADQRDMLTLLRTFEWLPDMQELADPATVQAPHTQYLEDQQVAIVRRTFGDRRLLVALGGGSNGERHNHNDLGHFLVALDERIIVPDLGAPVYVTDFFGPKRYTYLPASSRGHCCPLINDMEQIPGLAAKGVVLERQLDRDHARFTLDLTAGYPPEAGLQRWTRTLAEESAATVIRDEYELTAPGVIRHVLWFAANVTATGARIEAGGLRCELLPAPDSISVHAVDPTEHRLREFAKDDPLYRVEAVYGLTGRQLTVETRLTVG